MSSWKKTAKSHQRIHHERHQPEGRSHLGILEKKKDYKERAEHFQRKEAVIKKLKVRALNRNPDEFYFHMINSRVKDGVHQELAKKDEHTPEQIKLMETQDLKYVRTRRTMETRKIGKLQSKLHLIDVANNTSNTHVFFVDSVKEAKEFNVAAHLDTHPSLLKRRTNRLKVSTLRNLSLPQVEEADMSKAESSRNNAYAELSNRIQREKELKIIEEKLNVKRHLQTKNVRRKVIKKGSKDAAPIVKWAYDRKR